MFARTIILTLSSILALVSAHGMGGGMSMGKGGMKSGGMGMGGSKGGQSICRPFKKSGTAYSLCTSYCITNRCDTTPGTTTCKSIKASFSQATGMMHLPCDLDTMAPTQAPTTGRPTPAPTMAPTKPPKKAVRLGMGMGVHPPHQMMME
jgi:hypothetical protein